MQLLRQSEAMRQQMQMFAETSQSNMTQMFQRQQEQMDMWMNTQNDFARNLKPKVTEPDLKDVVARAFGPS